MGPIDDKCVCAQPKRGGGNMSGPYRQEPRQTSQVPCSHRLGKPPRKVDSLDAARQCKKYNAICGDSKSPVRGAATQESRCPVNKNSFKCGNYIVAENYTCVCPPGGKSVDKGQEKNGDHRAEVSKRNNKASTSPPRSRTTKNQDASCQCGPDGRPLYRDYSTEHEKCPASMNRYEKTKLPEEKEFGCVCPQEQPPPRVNDNFRFVQDEAQRLTDARENRRCPGQCSRRPCYKRKVLVSTPYMSCRCAAYEEGRYADESGADKPIITGVSTREIRPATNRFLIEQGSFCGVEYRHIDVVKPTPRMLAAKQHGRCPGYEGGYPKD